MPVTIQPTTLRYKNGNAFSTVDCLKGDPGSISSIAPDYSNLTFPVAEGKLCTHEDKLYKANQAIATSEAWTAAHWTETTIEAELQNSGSGTMFVTVTSEEVSGEEVFSADKTVAEIKAAILADKNVIVLTRNSAGQSDYERGYYTLDHITETSGHTTIVFIRMLGESVEAVVFESQSGMQNDSIIIAENILVTNLEAVAPYYQDLSFPILQGTLCFTEDHVLYKANQNINSQEDFDPLHWVMTNIANELQNGSGKFVITISTERPRGGTRSNPTLYSDKSSADIWEAIDAGNVIMIADVTDDDYNGDAVSALVDGNCDRNNGYVTLSTRPSTERNIHYTIGLVPYQPYDVQKTLDFNVVAYGDGTCNLIDDTAGEGTTDLVWSADKSYAEVSNLQNGKAPIIIDTASGAIASFPDGADNLPLEHLVVNIEPVQSGSGDPSPTNVRPISGWTGANVTQIGKNLYQYDIHKIQTVTTSTSTTRACMRTGLFGGTYSFSGSIVDPSSSVTTSNINIAKYKNGIATLLNTFITPTNIVKRTFTVADDEEVILMSSDAGLYSITSNLPKYNIQIERGSTITDYQAPVHNTYSITWQTEAGTVYGGSLDLNTGTLTVTHAQQVFTGEETWGINQTANFYTQTGYSGQAINVLCSHFPSNSMVTTGTDDNCYISGTGYLNVQTTAIEHTAAAMKTYCADQYANNTPLTIFYPSSVPQTYQLTPIELRTLFGINNIWADCGNTTVEYRADTKLFVDKNATVHDVQINGNSILDTQGTAIIPIAGTNQFGVMQVHSTYGIGATQGGYLYNVNSTDAQIKTGTNSLNTITPSNQHKSTFYALAKLAGADMASVTGETVGVYPEVQKIAIQKMLGIYEAPWELIVEDSFTNATEASYEISVDSNGNPFELTDVRIIFKIPQQNVEAKVANGSLYFNYGLSDQFVIAYDTITVAAESVAKIASIQVIQKDGILVKDSTPWSNQSTLTSVRRVSRFEKTEQNHPWQLTPNGKIIISKMTMLKTTGTVNYLLYGKRKWWT